MTDLGDRATSTVAVRDASLRLASLPFFFRPRARALLVAFALLLAPRVPLSAQGPAPRPWLDWHTVETQHFVIHYPADYRAWALSLAERIEALRKQVDSVVGFAPQKRVNIVIDDPVNDANGYAFTTLDAPTIVLWPVSPDPRSEIGDFEVWQEVLVTHEFAHVAHLTRPSRNKWQQLIHSLSPIPLGPIVIKAPRWVAEGYATYVEGKVSGTGRPNHAWRAAILRQFALEGRLPSYGQLSSTAGWINGSFAYLAGSAFLEWLARREGDSSLVALWRRMTAKTDRSFDAAFVGLYGRSPSELYGQFVVELTASAVEVSRQLQRQQLTEGTLVQRLARSTGDPAISPDGRFIALTLRKIDAPGALVVWKTADEPDTLAEKRREAQLRRDPQDVPDRTFFPPPKRVVATLVSGTSTSYETPRWFADNKHLLVSRVMPRDDGTLRPDLFIWSAEDGTLERVTRGAALRDADPSADGRWAAAVRCEHGWCDLVRLDFATKSVRVLRSGSVARNYYRPRVSARTGEIAVAEQLGDRWRIARVSAETGELRYADPDDGVNRFDATFDPDGATIYATSERAGFANIERLAPDGGEPVPITRVTGAAVAADVAPDHTVWFLNLQASGYDLRRVAPDSARPPLPVLEIVLDDSLSAVVPPRHLAVGDSATRSRDAVRTRAPTPTERAYGVGPSRFRYLPSGSSGYGGSTTTLAIVRSDPVGRLSISLMGAVGAGTLPAGVAFDLTSQRRRTSFGANAWVSHEAPSRELSVADSGIDLARAGGALRLDRTHVRDAGSLATTFALLAERQRPSDLSEATRGAAVLGFTGTLRQFDEDVRYLLQLSGLGEIGGTADGRYARQRTSLVFGTARGFRSLITGRIAYGTIGGGKGFDRERYVIGGFHSPLIDPLFDARRVEAPAYPLGSAVGTTFASYRAGLPIDPIEIYYSGVSTDFFQNQLRAYGAEYRQRVPSIAALGTPEVDVITGFARALDAPVRHNWRYYVSLTLRP